MVDVQLLADSICNKKRIFSVLVTYPRSLHAERLRHRILNVGGISDDVPMLSCSVASSRAITGEKMIQKVKDSPYIPFWWGQNQKGMSTSKEIDDIQKSVAYALWMEARDNAIKTVESMNKIGVSKEIKNRLLEPWMHVTEIITGTDWGNFFNLRVHKDAEPNIREVAKQCLDLYESSKPTELQYGQWHLPFVKPEDREALSNDESLLLKVSFARCARTSYLNFDGVVDYAKDFDLHDRLISAYHLSPAEHQATPLDLGKDIDFELIHKYNSGKDGKRSVRYYVGNFEQWVQYRKTLPNENRENFDADQLRGQING